MLSKHPVSVEQAVKSTQVLLIVKPHGTVWESFEEMPHSVTCHTDTCTDSGGECMNE
jgi:hypothetical protein